MRGKDIIQGTNDCPLHLLLQIAAIFAATGGFITN